MKEYNQILVLSNGFVAQIRIFAPSKDSAKKAAKRYKKYYRNNINNSKVIAHKIVRVKKDTRPCYTISNIRELPNI
jgi:hypothetical protein